MSDANFSELVSLVNDNITESTLSFTEAVEPEGGAIGVIIVILFVILMIAIVLAFIVGSFLKIIKG